MAEYYFESREIRDQFLSHLASRGELRAYFERAREACDKAQSDSAGPSLLPYKLFRADAAAWLSNYEEAIDAYRELNRLYPNTPEFAERLISFTRSLGQHNRRFLEESGAAAHALADAVPSAADYRTRAGEIQADLGDYNRARGEWEQLIALGRGGPKPTSIPLPSTGTIFSTTTRCARSKPCAGKRTTKHSTPFKRA